MFNGNNGNIISLCLACVLQRIQNNDQGRRDSVSSGCESRIPHQESGVMVMGEILSFTVNVCYQAAETVVETVVTVLTAVSAVRG